MPNLGLWEEYSREDVHSIFSPNTKFTPQAGTWGLQGIVRVPDRFGDWVFFVTYGRSQGDHEFDESITVDGVLSWQSQPSQRLDDEVIREFVEHDDRTNSIHLFLRTADRSPYTYLGALGYLTHDHDREKPVHFQWQLLDGAPPDAALKRMNLRLVETIKPRATGTGNEVLDELVIVAPPARIPSGRGVSTKEFKARKTPDYAARDERNRKLGMEGEELVLVAERKRLTNAGRADLAKQIAQVSVTEGDGAGFDIRSFEEDGSPRFIEVKTTEGDIDTSFFLSANEVSFGAQNAKNYYLYRIFEFDPPTRTAKGYVIRGNLQHHFDLVPTAYRAQRRR